VDEERAQIDVSALGDAPQAHMATGGVLPLRCPRETVAL
jgi:hypothetical protein